MKLYPGGIMNLFSKKLLLLFSLLIVSNFLTITNAQKSEDVLSFKLNQTIGNSVSRSISIADIDSDGDLDAFITNDFNEALGKAGENKLLINNGKGIFSVSKQDFGNKAGFGGKGVFGDIDCDGDIDLLLANTNDRCELWKNNGKGVFSNSGISIGNGNYTDVKISDLDDDGDLDAFMVNVTPNSKTKRGGGFEVWLNDGVGNFNLGQKSEKDGNTPVACTLGDIDSDGDLDAVVGGFYTNNNPETDYSPNRIYLNNGSGHFSEDSVPYYENLDHVHYLELADIDNDEDLDLIVALTGGTFPIKIYYNDGNGNFKDEKIEFNSLWNDLNHHVTVGDFNNDGYNDLFLARGLPGSRAGCENTIWLNKGGKLFVDSKQRIGDKDYISWEAALGDLDGDGDLDIFIASLYWDKKSKKLMGAPNEVFINNLISK